MRLTRDELKVLLAKPSRSKYRAQRCEWNGINFPSKAECARYQQLFLLQLSGQISNLAPHPKLPIVINGVKVCVVEADACYFENGKRVYEDLKGKDNAMSRLKRRLVSACFPGIDWRVVKA